MRPLLTNLLKSLVVDLRRKPVDHTQITDVFEYLERGDSFQSRTNAERVIYLVRVIVYQATKDIPAVEISVSGTHRSPAAMRSGIGCVQSFVLQSKFVPIDLSTVECLEELKGFYLWATSS